jgi:hypothetical protein
VSAARQAQAWSGILPGGLWRKGISSRHNISGKAGMQLECIRQASRLLFGAKNFG